MAGMLWGGLLSSSAVVVALLALAAAPSRPFSVTTASTLFRAGIWGIAFDSITKRPLVGASILIAKAPDSVRAVQVVVKTDSVGRFSADDLEAGSYRVEFSHPLLDSLGLTSPRYEVRILNERVRQDVAVPSPVTLRRLACGDGNSRAGGLLIGHVRDTRSRAPVSGASVHGTWMSLDSSSGSLGLREKSSVPSTSASGWFALCEAEPDVPILVRAAMNDDSTGWVRTTVPAESLRHLPLLVGGGTRVRAAGGDGQPNGMWTGTAKAMGTVLDERGRPSVGANVTVWGTTAQARTNTRGAFVLEKLPGGTHTLEVKAVGAVPAEQVVNLVPDSTVVISVQLAAFVPQLPGVSVRAEMPRIAKLSGFHERRRDVERGINYGYFITADEISERRPPLISSMLEGVPGVTVRRLGPNSDPRRSSAVLGTAGCPMTVYLDGHRVIPANLGVVRSDSVAGVYDGTSFNELIPQWNAIAGIEVYPRSVGAPPQYQALTGSCGVVLIWTK